MKKEPVEIEMLKKVGWLIKSVCVIKNPSPKSKTTKHHSHSHHPLIHVNIKILLFSNSSKITRTKHFNHILANDSHNKKFSILTPQNTHTPSLKTISTKTSKIGAVTLTFLLFCLFGRINQKPPKPKIPSQ